MFTDESTIRNELKRSGFQPDGLSYINRGVMTDKYSFRQNGKRYIVRCFPPKREQNARTEFEYMALFRNEGIKAPIPCLYSESGVPLLVYEMLDGHTLADIYNSLSASEKLAISHEIADNYNRMSQIATAGYGKMESFGKFEYRTWQEFLLNAIEVANKIAEENHDAPMLTCYEKLAEMTPTIKEPQSRLVWSDFSSDNIIVTDNGHLSGFIDFDGLLSGDPMLGLGYFIARESNSELRRIIMASFDLTESSYLIDYYALIRWCRLLPYAAEALPNGEKRLPLNEFLPHSYDLISKLYKYGHF